MKGFAKKLHAWMITIDPGLTRLEQGGVALFSVTSAWLIMRAILQAFGSGLARPEYLGLALFAPIITLACNLVIIDLRPLDRRNTLLISILPIAAILSLFTTLFTLFPQNPWIFGFILLVLFFFSFYLRRFGARMGELLLVTTITFFFATHAKITFAVLPWFLLTVPVGVLSIYLWQFVLIRYNPVRLLRRTSASYYQIVSIGLGEIILILRKKRAPPHWEKSLERQLQRVSACRKVIETEFAAVVSPPVWTQSRLNRLKIDYYNTEQGFELMTSGVRDLAQNSLQMPPDVFRALMKTLETLQEVLLKVASPASEENLDKQSSLLRKTVDASDKERVGSAWNLPVFRIVTGGIQLNRAVKDAREVENDRSNMISYEQGQISNPIDAIGGDQETKQSAMQTPTVLSGLGIKTLHLTTLLGLQASLAAFLAMLVAYFTSLEQASVIFLTAFLVIAGSTGESLRRMSLRVVGTVAGVVAGVILSLILTNLDAGSTLLIILVAVFMFLIAFFAITSYTWMIIWISVVITLLVIGLGGVPADVLIYRPLNTFIGASLAALVVVFVLPIHTRELFNNALSKFLNALDQYLSVYMAKLNNCTPSLNLDAVIMQLDTSFSGLEKTFPSLAMEYNPLTRAQSPLTEQSTILHGLKLDVIHMNQDLMDGLVSPIEGETGDLTTAIKDRVHDNIVSLNNLLSKKPAGEVRNFTDLFAKVNQSLLLEQVLKSNVNEHPDPKTKILTYLARINQDIYQLATGLTSAKL